MTLGEEVVLPDRMSRIPDLFIDWGLNKEPQECVWVVSYDAQLTLRTVTEVARGTHRGAQLHVPTLLAAVLTAGTERFMLVHNHPAGSIQPSRADIEMNNAVMDAANATGLYYEDHFIITPAGHWLSLVDAGFLKPAIYKS